MHRNTIRFIRRLLIGIIVLVVLAVAGDYFYTRHLRNGAEARNLPILDAEMVQSARSIEYSDNQGGTLRFRIRAQQLDETRQGKNFLQGIEAFDFNPDGSVHNRICSRNAVYDQEYRTVDFSGDVRIYLGKDIELRTGLLHYDMGTNAGSTEDWVQFYSGMVNGKARGLNYDLGNRLLVLRNDVDFLIKPDENTSREGSDAVETVRAVSETALCYETRDMIEFHGHARLESDSLLLEGDTIEVGLDRERKAVESLVSSGNAHYTSRIPGESRAMTGDRMVFDLLPGGRNLKYVSVSGDAKLAMTDTDETRTLKGEEIELFFDPQQGKLERLEGRSGVRLETSRGTERTQIYGERFRAFFAPESGMLKTINVLERAGVAVTGAGDSEGNEIRGGKIYMTFQEVGGRAVLERLRAEEDACWILSPADGDSGSEPRPAGRLDANAVEMFYSATDGLLDRIEASGRVVMTEMSPGGEISRPARKISAERTRFHFFPGKNSPKDMAAEGGVRVMYTRDSATGGTPGGFETSSDSLEAEFAPEAEGIDLVSASQWGNFVYTDATGKAVSGRCDYDARQEKIRLSQSPEIEFEMGSSTGDIVEIDRKRSRIRIDGAVRSELAGVTDAGNPGGSMADSRSLVLAGTMLYDPESRHIRYEKSVSLLSESQQLEADALDIFDGGARMEAEGNVVHHLSKNGYQKGNNSAETEDSARKGSGNSSNMPINIKSSELKYSKDTNTVKYSGNITLVSSDLILTAATLEAVLGDSSKAVERATARENVVIVKGGRKYIGDVAYYFSNPEKFEVLGSPAEYIGPDNLRTFVPRLTYDVTGDRILLEGQ